MYPCRVQCASFHQDIFTERYIDTYYVYILCINIMHTCRVQCAWFQSSKMLFWFRISWYINYLVVSRFCLDDDANVTKIGENLVFSYAHWHGPTEYSVYCTTKLNYWKKRNGLEEGTLTKCCAPKYRKQLVEMLYKNLLLEIVLTTIFLSHVIQLINLR